MCLSEQNCKNVKENLSSLQTINQRCKNGDIANKTKDE